MKRDQWLVLIINLPGKKAAVRMRFWRSMKKLGSATLRDGVYLLPKSAEFEAMFMREVDNLMDSGGSAFVLAADFLGDGSRTDIKQLFNRQSDYDCWNADIRTFKQRLNRSDETEVRRALARFRNGLDQITATDFFPDHEKGEAEQTLHDMTIAATKALSPGEPSALTGIVTKRKVEDFQNQSWATRKSLWMDRVASAWLIQRFVDASASFLWLDCPQDCPDDAHGFDFDGAEFSHVGDLVTFEALTYAFDLEDDDALAEIGRLVHFVDVGGTPVADAAGFESLLGGMKRRSADDDELLAAAIPVFDHLYEAYSGD